MQHRDLYLIDDRMLCWLLCDLDIYDYIPSLVPLRSPVLRLAAKIKKLRETTRGAINDKVRGDYDELIRRFYSLFKPADYEKLRTFFYEKKKLDAKTIIFSDSPY